MYRTSKKKRSYNVAPLLFEKYLISLLLYKLPDLRAVHPGYINAGWE